MSSTESSRLETVENGELFHSLCRNSMDPSPSPSGSHTQSAVHSSSPVQTCSINSVQRLADLRIGGHVTWPDRGSPMLVVGIGYRHVDSIPSAVPAHKYDQPTHELCVTLRGRKGGECDLYHRPDGPTSIVAVPLNKFGWIDQLYRLGPRVSDRSFTRSRTPEDARSNGGVPK